MSFSIFLQNKFAYDNWDLLLRYGVEEYQLNESSPDVTYNYDYSDQEFVSGIPFIPFFEVRGSF